jgi:predicted nuclease of predicted toxin-antitoxin system
MRFLANENVPYDVVVALQDRGHDVAWVRTDAPGSRDREVLARAMAEERILLTFDKDFGELAFRERLPASCGIILFRIPTPSPADVARRVVAAVESRDDWAGHFAVVEEDRIRMRPLPQGT